jgi:hypothetical protein
LIGVSDRPKNPIGQEIAVWKKNRSTAALRQSIG